MARKTRTYTVEDEGRDYGKRFLITEMDAERAENWAMRALLALIANNVDLPEGFESLGMAGLAEVGVKALGGLKWDVVKPLFDEMLECVEYLPDPKKPHVQRALVSSDIEEVSTRIKLRMEVFNLHIDFSKAAGALTSQLGKRAAAKGVSATATARR